jgi:hypothetical protein
VCGSGSISPHILTSAPYGDELPASRFTPDEKARGTLSVGGWVSPMAGLADVKERDVSAFFGIEFLFFYYSACIIVSRRAEFSRPYFLW